MYVPNTYEGRRGRDRMVAGFKLPVQSVAIPPRRDVLDTTLCDEVCQ